jgi:hypothetical protein
MLVKFFLKKKKMANKQQNKDLNKMNKGGEQSFNVNNNNVIAFLFTFIFIYILYSS